jgi:hypothetical protein
MLHCAHFPQQIVHRPRLAVHFAQIIDHWSNSALQQRQVCMTKQKRYGQDVCAAFEHGQRERRAEATQTRHR